MSLSSAQRRGIIKSVLTNQHTFADLGRKYGVSREYIRQLANDAGTTGRELRSEKLEDALSAEAEDLVVDRESWVPPRWASRIYTRAQFEAFLKKYDKGLLKRWKAAQALPLSRSGHAHPETQRCTDCKLWKPWEAFYSDTSRVYGKSSRCQDCAKTQAREQYEKGKT